MRRSAPDPLAARILAAIDELNQLAADERAHRAQEDKAHSLSLVDERNLERRRRALRKKFSQLADLCKQAERKIA